MPGGLKVPPTPLTHRPRFAQRSLAPDPARPGHYGEGHDPVQAAQPPSRQTRVRFEDLDLSSQPPSYARLSNDLDRSLPPGPALGDRRYSAIPCGRTATALPLPARALPPLQRSWVLSVIRGNYFAFCAWGQMKLDTCCPFLLQRVRCLESHTGGCGRCRHQARRDGVLRPDPGEEKESKSIDRSKAGTGYTESEPMAAGATVRSARYQCQGRAPSMHSFQCT